MVRAVLGHVSKVVRDWLERVVLTAARNVAEFDVMDTVRIDLLVVEAGRADEAVPRVYLFCFVSQTRKGGERAVFGEPAGDGARVDSEAEAPTDVVRRTVDAVAL